MKGMKSLSALAMMMLVTGWSGAASAARDAAFLTPSASSSAGQKSDDVIAIEPKPEVDAGDTPINVGRRATFFFVNQTNLPVEIESITANGDSNVKAEIVGDDCSKEKRILPASRCSVTIETTPTGSGSWAAELLMTHKSAGRIARAKVTGKTAGGATAQRELGLAMSTKDVKPVDFGEVEVGTGKAVRTALMVNDSNEIISILSIEVIAPENGLERLDQGCTVDMDLKMGESCPITLLWKPEAKGAVSTDLIIRHTGRLGFAVIPVRGTAKDPKGTDTGKAGQTNTSAPAANEGTRTPAPPTAEELESMLTGGGKIPPISESDLPKGVRSGGHGVSSSASANPLSGLHLIGTIGNRALFYKPDGTTAVVAIGEDVPLEGDKPVKLVNVGAKDAEVFYNGKKATLKLEAASALTQRAAAANTQNESRKPVDREQSNNSDPASAGRDNGGANLSKSGASVPLPVGR